MLIKRWNKIVNAVNEILKEFPETTEVYLTGSYLYRNPIDEFSSLEEQEQKIKDKGRLSDIDLVLVPNVFRVNKEVDLLYEWQEPKKLIWKNNKFIKL